MKFQLAKAKYKLYIEPGSDIFQSDLMLEKNLTRFLTKTTQNNAMDPY